MVILVYIEVGYHLEQWGYQGVQVSTERQFIMRMNIFMAFGESKLALKDTNEA